MQLPIGHPHRRFGQQARAILLAIAMLSLSAGAFALTLAIYDRVERNSAVLITSAIAGPIVGALAALLGRVGRFEYTPALAWGTASALLVAGAGIWLGPPLSLLHLALYSIAIADGAIAGALLVAACTYRLPAFVAPFPEHLAATHVGPDPDGVRQILDAWQRGWSLTIPALGRRIGLGELRPSSGYTGTLKSLTECRTVAIHEVPGDAGTGRSALEAQQLVIGRRWSYALELPDGYHGKRQKLEFRDMAESQSCRNCRGAGDVECWRCTGTGRVMQAVREVETAADGQQTSRVVQRQENCPMCWGSGDTRCTPCRGTGRRTLFPVLHAEHSACEIQRQDDADSGIGAELQLAAGTSLYDAHADRPLDLATLDHLTPRARSLAEQLLAANSPGPDERVVRQHLAITAVPLLEVTYTYRQHRFTLWIYGDDNRVFAPDSPIARGRLAVATASWLSFIAAHGALAFALWSAYGQA